MEWISVEDKMPEPETEVLCINSMGVKVVGWLFYGMKNKDEKQYVCDAEFVKVVNITHWVPLPEPPKD